MKVSQTDLMEFFILFCPHTHFTSRPSTSQMRVVLKCHISSLLPRQNCAIGESEKILKIHTKTYGNDFSLYFIIHERENGHSSYHVHISEGVCREYFVLFTINHRGAYVFPLSQLDDNWKRVSVTRDKFGILLLNSLPSRRRYAACWKMSLMILKLFYDWSWHLAKVWSRFFNYFPWIACSRCHQSVEMNGK